MISDEDHQYIRDHYRLDVDRLDVDTDYTRQFIDISTTNTSRQEPIYAAKRWAKVCTAARGGREVEQRVVAAVAKAQLKGAEIDYY